MAFKKIKQKNFDRDIELIAIKPKRELKFSLGIKDYIRNLSVFEIIFFMMMFMFLTFYFVRVATIAEPKFESETVTEIVRKWEGRHLSLDVLTMANIVFICWVYYLKKIRLRFPQGAIRR